ncbi:MAG: hypothetical protein QXK87_05210 [Fervidicoccaceae archaeon]
MAGTGLSGLLSRGTSRKPPRPLTLPILHLSPADTKKKNLALPASL